MRLQLPSLLSIVIAVMLIHSSVAEEKPRDRVNEKLQGRWQIVSGINQGRKVSKTELAGTYVTVTANSIVVLNRSRQQRFEAVLTIDDTQKPTRLTMKTIPADAELREPEPGIKITPNALSAGILKFKDDHTWVLCYALPGASRPEKFESPPGSRVMLFTLEKMRSEGDAEGSKK